ncbi:ribonuclease H family protein [Streptomyces stramineus]
MIGGMVERIIAACDGASKGNPGPAAWGWVIGDADGNVDRWESGPLGTATNNVAELTALERLLAATDPAVPMQVRMDSQYAMKAVTTWLPGWKKKGWKTAAGKPVANKDLVVSIEALLSGRTVDFLYVPAHQVDGDPLNAFADRAASHAAVTQQAAGTALGSGEPPLQAAAAPSRGGGGARRTGAAKAAGGVPKQGGTKRAAGTIAAKFPGRCRCGKPYASGEQIAKNPQGWGHPACRAESTTAG